MRRRELRYVTNTRAIKEYDVLDTASTQEVIARLRDTSVSNSGCHKKAD